MKQRELVRALLHKAAENSSTAFGSDFPAGSRDFSSGGGVENSPQIGLASALQL
jgi:hypothetical protein